MALGPGKYDTLCTEVRTKAKAESVILIIIGGDKGNGFSVQAEAGLTLKLPDILRSMADQIEESIPKV